MGRYFAMDRQNTRSEPFVLRAFYKAAVPVMLIASIGFVALVVDAIVHWVLLHVGS